MKRETVQIFGNNLNKPKFYSGRNEEQIEVREWNACCHSEQNLLSSSLLFKYKGGIIIIIIIIIIIMSLVTLPLLLLLSRIIIIIHWDKFYVGKQQFGKQASIREALAVARGS